MIMLNAHRTTFAPPRPCERIAERAHAWFDGELAAAAVVELEAHLASCTACRQIVDAEARFAGLLRARLRIDRAPASLYARVRAMVRART